MNSPKAITICRLAPGSLASQSAMPSANCSRASFDFCSLETSKRYRSKVSRTPLSSKLRTKVGPIISWFSFLPLPPK